MSPPTCHCDARRCVSPIQRTKLSCHRTSAEAGLTFNVCETDMTASSSSSSSLYSAAVQWTEHTSGDLHGLFVEFLNHAYIWGWTEVKRNQGRVTKVVVSFPTDGLSISSHQTTMHLGSFTGLRRYCSWRFDTGAAVTSKRTYTSLDIRMLWSDYLVNLCTSSSPETAFFFDNCLVIRSEFPGQIWNMKRVSWASQTFVLCLFKKIFSLFFFHFCSESDWTRGAPVTEIIGIELFFYLSNGRLTRTYVQRGIPWRRIWLVIREFQTNTTS